ncbi:MAG: hypothetical protein R3A52_30550, partial [Polyangiales bacterium]
MIELFDVFPFNLPPGMTFFGVYIVATIAAFALARALSRAIAGTLAPAPAAAPGSAPDRAAAYRQGYVESRPTPLAVGWLPSGEQVYTVAWLEGGDAAVQRAILAALAAEGWVAPSSAS